jgi:hypothetical protein
MSALLSTRSAQLAQGQRPVDLDGVIMATRQYGKTSSRKVARAMHERKQGTLRSGRSGEKVTSRKQAIAIGLSEARRAGAKVPKKKTRGSKRRS